MSFDTNSEYVIFNETAVTEISKNIFPLEDLIKYLNKYRRILENLSPNKLGVLIPLVIPTPSGFSIALALKPSTQGSILNGNGIKESARNELVEKIKTAEKIAFSSIQSGKQIARKLSEKQVSKEEFDLEMQNVDDEKITREAIHLERMPPLVIDFQNTSVTVGANRKNPTHVFSSKKVKYKECFVKKSLGKGVFQIHTPDALSATDKMVSKNGLIEVSCDEHSANDTLIQLTHLLNVVFDFEGLVSDQIRTRKKFLRIAHIDHQKITSEIEFQWTSFKENLSLDF